tara:strand:- start:339 stop:473 length:135 start_codon:yes stop_codon:yes gene_type:complete
MKINTLEMLQKEFHQNRLDDKDFAQCYRKDEFLEWLNDYEIKTT